MTIPWNQRAWFDDPEPPEWDDEPIGDDCMAEDYLRAIDDLNGLYPHHFDHDRLHMETHDGRTDFGDDQLPPF